MAEFPDNEQRDAFAEAGFDHAARHEKCRNDQQDETLVKSVIGGSRIERSAEYFV